MQPNEEGNYWQGAQEDETSAPGAQERPQPLEAQNSEQQLPTEGEDVPYDLSEPVSWEASEYIHHDRDSLWFIVFIVTTIVLLAVSIVLVKNYFFTALIIVMAVALFIYVRRPPRVMRYTLSAQGLHIGQQFHFFNEFRSFGIIRDGALFSVRLLPTARFGQALTLYFAENDGERIVDILAAYLPMENLNLDLIDNLLRRLRL